MRIAVATLALALPIWAAAAPGSDPAPHPSPIEAGPGDAAPAANAPDWAIRNHMDQHFAFVTDALFFTFAGNLDGLRAEAAGLAKMTHPEDRPESWTPHLKSMRDKAAALSKVESLDGAARGVVAITESCAACHEAHDKPEMKHGKLIDNPDLFGDAPMDRHQWAAYLMWIGLVVPDEQTWKTGVEALEHQTGGLPEVPASAGLFEAVVHTWSASAAAAETWVERRTAYAGMLATCAACHEKLEVEMP